MWTFVSECLGSDREATVGSLPCLLFFIFKVCKFPEATVQVQVLLSLRRHLKFSKDLFKLNPSTPQSPLTVEPFDPLTYCGEGQRKQEPLFGL